MVNDVSKNKKRAKAASVAKKVGSSAATRARRVQPKKQVAGFMDFVREQGVVGLAIGLAVGTQASELVKQIVASLVDPIIGLILGNPQGLQAMTWTLQIGDRAGTFALGKLVYALIVFMMVALIIYFAVMSLKLDKLDKKKG